MDKRLLQSTLTFSRPISLSFSFSPTQQTHAQWLLLDEIAPNFSKLSLLIPRKFVSFTDDVKASISAASSWFPDMRQWWILPQSGLGDAEIGRPVCYGAQVPSPFNQPPLLHSSEGADTVRWWYTTQLLFWDHNGSYWLWLVNPTPNGTE